MWAERAVSVVFREEIPVTARGWRGDDVQLVFLPSQSPLPQAPPGGGGGPGEGVHGRRRADLQRLLHVVHHVVFLQTSAVIRSGNNHSARLNYKTAQNIQKKLLSNIIINAQNNNNNNNNAKSTP